MVENSLSWPADVAQLLDEHHLVVIGDSAARRAALAQSLRLHLDELEGSRAVVLNGTHCRGLDDFCLLLENSLSGPARIPRSIPGLVEFLRNGTVSAHHFYLLWQDADVLLETDVELFGRIANVLLAVATEHEQLNPDVLTLQRTVFLGSDKLGAYAELETGQFQAWLEESQAPDLWEIEACVPRPPVLTYRLEG